MKKRVFVSTILINALFTPLQAYTLTPPTTPVPLSAPVELLKQMSREVATISETAKKALVFVSVSKTVQPPEEMDPFEYFFGPHQHQRPRQKEIPKQEGLGSGFFIDLEKGYLLTNNHVIDGADKIELKLANGHKTSAKLVGRDPNTDIAVLEIGDKNFPRNGLLALVLGDSDLLADGSFVIALGAPFGLESSVSFGIISALKRGSLQITTLGDFLQSDAAINPGNSGGPLVGVDGRVVGMNTAIASRSGANNGIGFAVPANLVRKIATNLINDGSVARGYVGVMLSSLQEGWADSLNLPKNTEGAILAEVVEGGPASAAGLEPGDVIIGINGQKITNPLDLTNIIGFMKPKEKATIEFFREGNRKTATVIIAPFPGAEQAPTLSNNWKNEKSGNKYGLFLEDLTENSRKKFGFQSKQGLVIKGVNPDSAAAEAGLRTGDLILSINGKKITSLAQGQSLLSQKARLILLHIERTRENGRSAVLIVPLENKEK
jgi:serine protease Do